MSFDIFLMSVPPETFDRTIVEREFQSVGISLQSHDDWTFHPPEGKLYWAGEADQFDTPITCFSVNRPPAGVFWQAIYQIMAGTRTFLVWPATDPPTHCVASLELARRLVPQLEDMGEPAFVRSPEEILEVIDASFASLR
ncbi:MAG TPA: hypothetical protein VHS81_13655 [Caulobacteraceae bacterium]|nr:hypothetical protein [Caulobacteraceae bacterium]